MFKNYLTYQMAVTLERNCGLAEMSQPTRQEALACCSAIVNQLGIAQRSQDEKLRAKSFFVSLSYLEDLQGILKDAAVDSFEIRGPFKVLQRRLEQLFVESSNQENGQLRMLA
jgi:hypothetical protein